MIKTKIQGFRDLLVWQISSRLSREVAALVRTFPGRETYALSDDLLRAARSIPANISEGFGRFHFAEKIQFYNIAKGSTLEVQNHLIEALNNKFIEKQTYDGFTEKYHIVEVKLNNLIVSTNRGKQKHEKKAQR